MNCRSLRIFSMLLPIVGGIIIPFDPPAMVSAESTTVQDELGSLHINVAEHKVGNHVITMAQRYVGGSLLTYAYLNLPNTAIAGKQLDLKVDVSLEDTSTNLKYLTMAPVAHDSGTSFYKYRLKETYGDDNLTRVYGVMGLSDDSDNHSHEYLDNLSKIVRYYFHGNTPSTLESYYKENETITITDKNLARYCYGDTATFFGLQTESLVYDAKYTDCWYAFFNTNRDIDELYEVEVSFVQIDWWKHGRYFEASTEFKDHLNVDFSDMSIGDHMFERASSENAYWKAFYTVYDSRTKTIDAGTSTVSSSDLGWFNNYKGEKSVDLENIMDLKEYDARSTTENPFVFSEMAETYRWGVHFLDTERKVTSDPYLSSDRDKLTASTVQQFQILRLKFVSNGKVFNLPAIDTPTNDFETFVADITDENDNPITEIVNSVENFFANLNDVIKYAGIAVGSVIVLLVVILIISKIVDARRARKVSKLLKQEKRNKANGSSVSSGRKSRK